MKNLVNNVGLSLRASKPDYKYPRRKAMTLLMADEKDSQKDCGFWLAAFVVVVQNRP